jgi:hypothetical protein
MTGWTRKAPYPLLPTYGGVSLHERSHGSRPVQQRTTSRKCSTTPFGPRKIRDKLEGAGMKAEANGRWIVTTVIAVLALAVSGYTAYAAWQNNATTVAALEETKRQFEATGPRYSAEAFARIYDTEANSWSSTEPEGTSLAFERMQPPTKEKLGYWTLDYPVDLHRCCSSTRWHPGFRSSSLLFH